MSKVSDGQVAYARRVYDRVRKFYGVRKSLMLTIDLIAAELYISEEQAKAIVEAMWYGKK